MPGIDEAGESTTALDRRPGHPREPGTALDIERLVDGITFNGKLATLIVYACEKALMYQPPLHADPGLAAHPGVQAALSAFAAWKQGEGMIMATHLSQETVPTKPLSGEPETLPLSLAGKWVAWSSDGMRIVASSESSEEAEQLAIAAGEPEPILERHPGRYRL